MRRILMMLPVLALASCQADLPTETDAGQLNAASSTGKVQWVFPDTDMNAPTEDLFIYILSEPRVANGLVVLNPPSANLNVFLSKSWHQDVNGDGEGDLIMQWDGERLCEVLFDAVQPSSLPYDSGVQARVYLDYPDYVRVVKRFNLSCGYFPA